MTPQSKSRELESEKVDFGCSVVNGFQISIEKNISVCWNFFNGSINSGTIKHAQSMWRDVCAGPNIRLQLFISSPLRHARAVVAVGERPAPNRFFDGANSAETRWVGRKPGGWCSRCICSEFLGGAMIMMWVCWSSLLLMYSWFWPGCLA